MPRDDWAKYRARDIGRRALREQSFDRPIKQAKRKARKPVRKTRAKPVRIHTGPVDVDYVNRLLAGERC